MRSASLSRDALLFSPLLDRAPETHSGSVPLVPGTCYSSTRYFSGRSKPVHLPVHGLITDYRPHVIPRLHERDPLGELLRIARARAARPAGDPRSTRVVGGERARRI